MTKAELNMLEKVFGAEISGQLYQTKSKIASKLEDEGYIMKEEKLLHDGMGMFKISGYVTTLEGNCEYCMSERCA